MVSFNLTYNDRCRFRLHFEFVKFLAYGRIHRAQVLHENEAKWTYIWNEFNGTELPDCLHVCDQSPPDPSGNQTRHWIKGNHVTGREANYTCDIEGQYMKTQFIYNEIKMICSLASTNSSAQWIWIDEGNRTLEVPECQVGCKFIN